MARRPRAGQVLAVAQTGSPGAGGSGAASEVAPETTASTPHTAAAVDGQGGAAAEHDRAAAHLPVPLADEGHRVRWVGVAGQQAVDGVLDVTVKGPLRRLPAGGRPGARVRRLEPTAHGEVGVAKGRGRHPEQVGDRVRVQSPGRAGGEDGTLQRRRVPHDGGQGRQHGVVGRPRRQGCAGAGTGPTGIRASGRCACACAARPPRATR